MTIGFTSKIWRRPALTRAFLNYYGSLRIPGCDVVCSAAVSTHEDPDTAALLQRPWRRWQFIEAPNRPLGAKGNAASHLLQWRRPRPAIVINVGSDDFVSAAYVASVLRAIEDGADYVVPSEVYFYEPSSGRACRQYSNHGLKAGAAVTARILDLVGWKPWREGDAPDFDLDAGLRRYARPVYLPEGSGVVVDVKAVGEQLSGYDEASAANRFIESVDADTLLSQIPGLQRELRDAGVDCLPVAA